MKTTVSTVQKMKDNGEKITMLTAYDYSTAKLFDEAGIDTMLVGDSLGMVMLGYDSTIPVTVDDMIHHGAAVVRGAENALIVVDMPFLSYHTSVYDAVANAGRIMKETGCTAVKLEGGKNVCPQIEAIVNAQIPVCAHIDRGSTGSRKSWSIYVSSGRNSRKISSDHHKESTYSNDRNRSKP